MASKYSLYGKIFREKRAFQGEKQCFAAKKQRFAGVFRNIDSKGPAGYNG